MSLLAIFYSVLLITECGKWTSALKLIFNLSNQISSLLSVSISSVSSVQSLSCVHLFVTPWTVHGILQARVLEWVAFPFSRDLPNPEIEPRSPAFQADSLPVEPHTK